MKRNYTYIILLAWLFAICAAAVPAPLAVETLNPSDYTQEIVPLKEHQLVTLEIVRNLKKNHFRKVSIDDALSSKVFDRYLSEIDPMRFYFLTSDIKELESYRYHLDDALVVGDVSPGFKIYGRYQTRFVQRLVFLINRIEHGLKNLDLEQEDSIDIDREKTSPWPSSRAEIEGLWLKGLKSDVINLKLDGKSMEEITDILSKRYHNQLKRVKQTASEDVFQIFMEALSSSYDPHTMYFSPRSSENFNINMSLSLEGIGAMLGVDNEYTKVMDLVPAGPADKSGQLKTGDRIIGVGQGSDGEITDVVGWRLDDVVELIRGPKDTTVRLKIIPANSPSENQTKIIKLTRNTVQLEEQAASKQIIEIARGGHTYKIGVIDIPTFYLDIRALQAGAEDYKSTTTDVRRLINELIAQKVDGIEIDLRDNGGGSLQEANSLVGLFIKRGPTVQIRNNDGGTDVLYDRDPRIFYSGPLAVVINRMSASASEIFAGAIQDYGRGIIIGENSFGKGTVQTLMTLSRGQLKITTAKFYRISGESTQHRGVIPDLYYPSLYDKSTIGESALKDALTWDSIGAAPHFTFADLTAFKQQLKSLHVDRMANNPDYNYTLGMIDYLKEAKAKTRLSLKFSTRLQEKKKFEKERLDLENKLRKAKGLKPYKNLDQINKEKEEDTSEYKRNKPAKNDGGLIEGGNILVDYFQLQDKANHLRSAKTAVN
jgi:carboxyl-terminal processing protease